MRRVGAAQLTGSLTDARSQPIKGGQVVVAPEQRGRTDLYKLAVSDQNGRFSFSDLVPGDYKLFGWGNPEPGAVSNPEFITRFEQQGRLVHIAESASEVSIRVIPIP